MDPSFTTAGSAKALTSVEIEVYRHLFASVAEEMGVRLQRSAFSPNIKERRDYSCAVFDADGHMVAQAAHIPVHLGSTPASVDAVMDAFPITDMRPDDVFVVNDPYAGGTHLPDITTVAPAFVEHRVAFLVCTRAHHADVGGVTPGSMPVSTHIDDEGIRIAPSRLDETMVTSICQTSRHPTERRGDLDAQRAAMRAGCKRLAQLVNDHGIDVMQRAPRGLMQYADRLVRHLINEMPDGEYNASDVMDEDGHGAMDIPIHCALTIKGESATFDFTHSADQVKGPINAVRAITVSAVNYAIRCLAGDSLPSNAGVMRSVNVVTRAGSIVDCEYPAAVAGGNVETSQRIVDVVFAALAQVAPDRIPAASQGTMNNLTIGGIDPRPGPNQGQSFAYYETIAGGVGAGPDADGGHAMHTHMTNTLNTPIEALEQAYPFRISRYQQRLGSGGRGRFRGGDGVIRAYIFDAPARVTLLTERRRHAPPGAAGGDPGAPGVNKLIRADGTEETLPGKISLDVRIGDTLEIHTPGGGGWGRPEC